MRTKFVVSALCMALLLAGCGKAKVSCADESAQNVVKDIVVNEAEKTIATFFKNSDGQASLDAAKVRATLKQIKLSIENVRTTKQDPNSTKVFCEGTIKITVPSDLLGNAEKSRELMQGETLDQLAQRNNFERSADLFTKNISYSAQPTDDGQKVYAELEGYKQPAYMLSAIAGSSLMKPVLEEKAKAQAKAQEDYAAEQVRAQAEADKQKNEQKEANLAMAKSNNALVNQQINEVWKSLPDFTQRTLLAQQRAWIKKKEIDCKVEASGKSTDAAEKEIHRLACDSEVTKARTSQLQRYLTQQ